MMRASHRETFAQSSSGVRLYEQSTLAALDKIATPAVVIEQCIRSAMQTDIPFQS